MKTTEKLLWTAAITGAAAVARAAVSHAVTKELFHIAVARECPHHFDTKARNRFAGSSRNRRFMQALSDGAVRLRRRPHEIVEITARDGQKLVGHWFPCPNAKRTILAMHGWRSSWASDFGMVHDFFIESKCNVLYAEQRGQGSSGGNHMGLGLLERYDCLEWTRWLEGDIPVYLAGVSMGATTVLMTAGFDLPPQVHGIIADCGFTSAYAIGDHVLRHNLHLSFRRRAKAASSMFRKNLQFEINEYSTLDALAEASVPVLFVHGSEDSFVPISMTYENYIACRSPKELLIVPGAEHGMSYYLDRGRYQSALHRFWLEYD